MSPSEEECREVMREMKSVQHKVEWKITLDSASSDCSNIVFSNISEHLVMKLELWHTSLDSHCVSELSRILSCSKTLKVLEFRYSPLPLKGLELISNDVSTNTTLKRLLISGDDTITDEDIPHICKIITQNTTLKGLHITSCPNITRRGMEQLSTLKAKYQLE